MFCRDNTSINLILTILCVWYLPGEKPSHVPSKLEELSLSSCSLNDSHFKALQSFLGEGGLGMLRSLTMANNVDLTQESLKSVQNLTIFGGCLCR